MFIKLLCILFPLLINGANENLLCIAEQPLLTQDTNRTFMSSVDYSNVPAIQKNDYLNKIYNGITQVKEKNKLYFSSTEAIINFVEHGNFIKNNILIAIISKIRYIGKCFPYSNNSNKSAHNNLIPEDNFIKSVLKKIEKRFLNEIDDDHLLKFFNQITFFADAKNNDLKLILDIQNNETQIKKNNPQEKLFCIVDATDLEREDISFVACITNNKYDDEKKIKQNISDLITKNKKLGFYSTASIIAFIKLGLPNKPPKVYLKNLIYKIEKCPPYNDNNQYIFNIQPGDTLIEFILEKIEKIFSNITLSAVDFDENIEFYEEDSVKKVRLKKHDHATIEIQNLQTKTTITNSSLFQNEKTVHHSDDNDIYLRIGIDNDNECNNMLSFNYFQETNTEKFKTYITTIESLKKSLAKKSAPVFFKNITAIHNFIYYIIDSFFPHDEYEENLDSVKNKLETIIIRLSKDSLYRNQSDQTDLDIKNDDDLIKYLLKNIEDFIFKKIDAITVITNLNNIKTNESTNSFKIHYTKSFFTIFDEFQDQRYDDRRNIIYHYNYIANISNSKTKQKIFDEINTFHNEIKKNKKIFFKNLNAIKNYIHCTIGHDNQNDLNKREMLFEICDALSQRPPYNTQRYQFKPEDSEIIELLEILEKIHNKELKEDEFKSYYERIIKKESISPKTNNHYNASTDNSKKPNNYEQMKTKNPEKNTPVSNTISAPENKKSSSENKNPSLKKSSIIKYLFGLTVCAASLIYLYKFFNPYILKRIYQPS